MKPTPEVDAWREGVKQHLSVHGRKAELARHLAARYGRTERSWQQSIQNILSRQVPNAELLLAINAWLSAQSTDGKPPKRGRHVPR